MGTTLVGSPETVIRGIERLQGYSGGGFGGVLFRAHEWATRELTLRSYELFARYVMPHFQGSLVTVRDSNEWARSNRKTVFGPNVEAVRRAYTDAGRTVPHVTPDVAVRPVINSEPANSRTPGTPSRNWPTLLTAGIVAVHVRGCSQSNGGKWKCE